MRVTGIRIDCFRIPFRGAYTTAAGSAAWREGILCRVRTSNGGVGLGEASFLPQSSEPFETLAAAAVRLSESAVGRDLDEIIRPLRPPLPAPDRIAWAGLETAVWDAKARSRGVSLASLLSSNPRDAVAVNALVSAPGVPEAEEAARQALARGFGTVKLKVGMAASLTEERQRVAAVRAAIGPDLKLRLDVNGAWEEERAIETIEALAEFDLEYVEQPVAPGALDTLRRVRLAVSVPIAADEDVTSIEIAEQIIQDRMVQVLVLKPIQLGGVGATLSIVAEATAAGLTPIVTSSVDTGVGIAVALQIAATLRSDLAAGLATADLLVSDLTAHPIPIVRGRMALPSRPGLGIDLDESELARFVTDSRKFGQIE